MGEETLKVGDNSIILDGVEIDITRVRVPWEFVQFALHYRNSPGVVGKVFLNMLGVEGQKINTQYKFDANCMRSHFVKMMRELEAGRLSTQKSRANGTQEQDLNDLPY